MAPPTLLVVGGGFAGINVAKGAKSAGYNVIVVDLKDFFDIKFASLRAAVTPSLVDKYAFKYSEIPGIGLFKQAAVTKISKTEAELSTGEIIKFDYAVIATGSTNSAAPYSQPVGVELAKRKMELKETAEAVKAAKSIVVVGGGPVGVELVGEIVDAFAGKNITLVHAGPRLFDGKPEKIGKTAEEWLKAHGVKLVLNEKADRTDTGVRLKSGKEITADLTIVTIGSKPNTQFLQSTEFASALDGAGRVKVDDTFHVVGYSNIFALGDITDIKEEKLGYLATLQAQLLAKNLAALLKKKDAKLTPWVPANGKPALFVTLGKGAGSGFLGGCVFPSCMVAQVKSKDLFVGKTRSDLGVK